MKRIGIIAPALVFVLVLSLIAAPHIVRAEDDSQGSGSTSGSGGSSDQQTEAQKQAAEAEQEAQQKAAEQAKEQAQKLAEQRKEAEQQRQEAQKKADEAAKEALEKQSEAVQEQENKATEDHTQAFKNACENRSESFKTRMTTVTTAIQNHAQELDTLVGRLKTYITDHNLTVANYATLLTAIETQKALVQSVASTAQQNAGTFDCSTPSSAKESLTGFSDVVKQEVDAVNAYKAAVQNLITAVKNAAATTTGGTSNAQ